MNSSNYILNKPIYPIAEAGRFVGLQSTRVRRWLKALNFLLCFSLSLPLSAQDANVTKDSAVEVSKSILKAYGGSLNLAKVDRRTTVMKMQIGNEQFKFAQYKSKTAIRGEMIVNGTTMIKVLDEGKGTEWLTIGDTIYSELDPKVKKTMSKCIKEGLHPHCILKLLETDMNAVKFHGRVKFKGKEYWAFSYEDELDGVLKCYFSNTTYLMEYADEGDENIARFQNHVSHDGVFIPEKVTVYDKDDIVIRTTLVTKVSSDFDDSWFVAPKIKPTPPLDEEKANEMLDKANVLIKARNYKNALVALEDAIDKCGSRTGLILSRANCYFMTKQYQKAIADYSVIVNGDPTMMDGLALFIRGEIYQNLGDKESAIADYSKLLELVNSSMYAKEAKARINILKSKQY